MADREDDLDWTRLPAPEAGPCPSPGELAAFVAGPADSGGRDRLLRHLTACAACREDVAAARGMPDAAPPVPAALKARLYRMNAPRPSILPKLAVAAAALFAVVVGAILLWPAPAVDPAVSRRPSPPPPVRVTEPPPLAPPAPLPTPEPPPQAPVPPPPLPAPTPEPPAPVPPPSPPPVPPPPPPAVATPEPAPPTPPAPTRPTLRGELAAVVGSAQARPDGDRVFSALRPGQRRDFAGTVELKADASPSKIRLGKATLFLRPRTEATLTLFEGETLVRLTSGEAAFDVTPGKDVFRVETPHGLVRVTGTRFRVALEKAATEVAVLRGSVEVRAQEQAVTLAAGEETSAPAGSPPKPPAKLDARAFQWVRALEETLALEVEAFALEGGMAVQADPAASGGRAVAGKGGRAGAAEARIRVKQPGPYAAWLRIHWGHNVPSVLSVQVHDHPVWDGRAIPFNTAWQWVRLGTFDLPAEPFRVRLSDPRGDARIDQVLLTTDLDHSPDEDRR